MRLIIDTIYAYGLALAYKRHHEEISRHAVVVYLYDMFTWFWTSLIQHGHQYVREDSVGGIVTSLLLNSCGDPVYRTEYLLYHAGHYSARILLYHSTE